MVNDYGESPNETNIKKILTGYIYIQFKKSLREVKFLTTYDVSAKVTLLLLNAITMTMGIDGKIPCIKMQFGILICIFFHFLVKSWIFLVVVSSKLCTSETEVQFMSDYWIYHRIISFSIGCN